MHKEQKEPSKPWRLLPWRPSRKQKDISHYPLVDAIRMPGLPASQYEEMAKKLPKQDILDALKAPAHVSAQHILVKRLDTTVPEWERLLRSKVLACPKAQEAAAQKLFDLCSGHQAPGISLAGGIAAFWILKEVFIAEAGQERMAALMVKEARYPEIVDLLRTSPNITSAKAQELMIWAIATADFGVHQQQMSEACFDVLCAGSALSELSERRLAENVAKYLNPACSVEARRAGNVKSDVAKEILDRAVYERGTPAMVSEILELRGGKPLKVDHTVKIG